MRKLSAYNTRYQCTIGKSHTSDGRKGTISCLLNGNWGWGEHFCWSYVCLWQLTLNFIFPSLGWFNTDTSTLRNYGQLTQVEVREKMKPLLINYHSVQLLFLAVLSSPLPVARQLISPGQNTRCAVAVGLAATVVSQFQELRGSHRAEVQTDCMLSFSLAVFYHENQEFIMLIRLW